MTVVTHETQDNHRRTPVEIIEMAREMLGTIDLDPASDEDANKAVKAVHFYDTDGLIKPWYGRVWLNPPGGMVGPDGKQLTGKERPKGSVSSAALWWVKLLESYRAGRVKEALYLSFNLEILRTAQTFGTPPQFYPFCVPRKRLVFESPAGKNSKQPMGASAIFYLGQKKEKFRSVFGGIGYCT